MINPPIISVILPVYNGEKYLRESIESIRNQTFTAWELIIVNDGSSDKSAIIAQAMSSDDPRIKYFEHSQNKGLPNTLNTGLQKVSGKYIARMDQDDISLPDRFERQYHFLEQNPDIFLVGGGYAPFNNQGHRIDIFHPESSLEIAWKFITNTYFCHPSVMFRKEIINKIGEYPNTGAEDFAFFSKIVHKYKCTNLKRIVIQYREHPENLSHQTKDKILASVKETFHENFIFYTNCLCNADIFYRYQSENKLTIKNLLKINRINHIIIKKIQKQYQLPYFSKEYFMLVLLIQIKNIRSLINNLLTYRNID
ncbi:MAG: glycosyltransferase [Patescibacteria group bacterium]